MDRAGRAGAGGGTTALTAALVALAALAALVIGTVPASARALPAQSPTGQAPGGQAPGGQAPGGQAPGGQAPTTFPGPPPTLEGGQAPTGASTQPAPSAAGGQPPPTAPGPTVAGGTLANRTVADVTTELALLVELDAFEEPVPPEVLQITDAVDLSPVGDVTSQDDLLAALETADGRGGTSLQLLRSSLEAEGEEPSPDVVAALSELGDSDYDLVESADAISIPAEVYLYALDDLWNRAGVEPDSPRTQIDPGSLVALVDNAGRVRVALVLGDVAPGQVPGVAPGGTVVGGLVPPANQVPPPPPDDRPGWVVPLAVAALLVAIGLIAWLLYRSRRSSKDADADAQLLGLAADLAEAGNSGEVYKVATTRVCDLLGATGGALVAVDGMGQDGPKATVTYETRDVLLIPDRLTDGLVRKAISTGQSIRETSQSEPAVAQLPASLLLLPVTVGGRVRGVLVLTRPEGREFDERDQALGTKAAPVVAAALENSGRLEEMAKLALVDGLTSLGNRLRLDQDLPAALDESAASGSPVSLVMIDVDHFKHFNDTNGHPAGDEALRRVSRILADNARGADAAYRFGGEEFCLVLRGTDEEGAATVAGRVREAVETADVPGQEHQPGGTLTASFGVATSVGGTAEDLKLRADRALYAAKADGRNRVVVASAIETV